MAGDSVEISVRGNWTRVPALSVGENTIIITGRYVRMAAVHDEDWSESELKDPAACVRLLKDPESGRPLADIFTFTQKLPATEPRYAYAREWESIAAVRLATFRGWWEALPQETRKNVRRSKKRGVVVRLSEFDEDLVRSIIEVNNDSPVRQGRRFPHYGKSLDQVKRDYSGFLDRSDFIAAYAGSELIGFLKLVYRGDIASVLQLLVKARHSDKRPANALIAKAIELCEAKRVQYLTYAKFNYGNKRHDSLAQFKTRNGFKEILMPRYYVPLTRWGAFCMKAKLHRGALGNLPGPVIDVGLAVRAKWYDVWQSTSRCSSTVEQPYRNRPTERSTPPAGSNP
jgi:hypothetical protein